MKVKKLMGRNPERVSVAGKLLEFDKDGCVETEDEAVLAKVKSMPTVFELPKVEENVEPPAVLPVEPPVSDQQPEEPMAEPKVEEPPAEPKAEQPPVEPKVEEEAPKKAAPKRSAPRKKK